MKGFFSGLLRDGLLWLLQQYRRLSIDLIKIEAAIWYLRGVQAVRRLFLSALALLFCILLGGVGFLLLHIGLYALLPWPTNAIVLIVLGAIYLGIALLGLGWACSEKTWMRCSHADRYAGLALKDDPPA